jgi:hypothetical protein
MRKWVVIGLAGAAASQSFGQGAALYMPVRSIKDQGITVRGWGSGTISETDELAYEGTYSVRVSTRNFFQGGILAMASPVDLAASYPNKNNLLRIMYRQADASMTFGGGPGAGRGGPGGDDLGGAGRRGPGGGPGAGAGPGAGRPGGATSASAAPDTTLTTIRLILTTSDGKKSEVYVPATSSGTGDRGWRSVAVPLQAIAGFGDSNKAVKEVAISGDALTTFYIGDIRIVNDSTPISGDASPMTMNLALGDQMTLTARGYGGASILKYSWDFDDKDGIQMDAEGQSVQRKFRKPGTYKITLTISDVFGLKAPYTTTLTATVNP